MEFKDYYQVLGVPKTASEKEIRQAFRKLARQHHPDVNPGSTDAEAKFKEINEAYEVLTDAEKRAKYDQYGAEWRNVEAWEKAGRPGPRPGSAPTGGPRGGPHHEYRTASPEDLQDLFGDREPFSDFYYDLFAGGRQGPPRPRRGYDVEAPVDVSLDEAFHGATRTLELAGADGNTRRLEVRIPPGVDTGSRVRLSGQGTPGANGGPAGDLYLAVTVRPHPAFRREGDDLRTRTEAPFATLVLGGEAEVRTLTGRVMLRVPAGTPDGRDFRLAGQGMPRAGGGRGDLHVEVHAAVPTNPTGRERELIEQLASVTTGDAA